MKITVIGPGAMGLLFGGKLAACADVSLIGSNAVNLKEINTNGVTIKRGDSSVTRKIPAYMAGTCNETADVILLFTKAYQIADVLTENKGLIGPDTMLLTLQNGAGHDRVMREFADSAHVLIGTTKQGRPLPRESRVRIKHVWRSSEKYLKMQASPAPSAKTSVSMSGIS